MDFNEVAREQKFSVKLANTGLKSKNGLVCGNAQIDDSVVQTNILFHNCEFFTFFSLLSGLRGTGLSVFCGLVKYFSRSIFELERQNWDGLVYAPDLLNLKFNLLRTTCDSLVRFVYKGKYFNYRLLGNLAGVGDHPFADSFVDEKNRLNSGKRFAHHDKTHFAFGSRVVHTTSNSYNFACMFLTKVFYGYVNFCETIIGVALGLDHSCVAKLVSAWVVGVFNKFS